ncbi:MAG: CUB domain-containing protein [Bacteroidales bacterium]
MSFSVEYQNNCNYDYLEIYDGNSASASLIGQYCGTNSPGTVEATNEEGALTFVFHSDGSVTEPGWTANVSCNWNYFSGG